MKFMVAVTTASGNTVVENLTQVQVNQLVSAFSDLLDLDGCVKEVFIVVSEMEEAA